VIAVSASQVFYTGDTATIRASAADLTGAVTTGTAAAHEIRRRLHG